MALALALFALAVIGATITMRFLSEMLKQQSGRNHLISAQAMAAADGALCQIISDVPPAGLLELTAGGPALDVGSVSPRTGLVVQRWITRLADNLFLVESRAAWGNPGGSDLATRSLGLLVRVSVDSAAGAQILLPIERRPWLQLY